MTILELITKKMDKEDNVQSLLGTEIKLRRNALSKTLEDISGKTCSVSYLSKVENSTIKANPMFLADICAKVRLSPDNIESIKESKAIFQKCIEALFQNDVKTIEYHYEMLYELKNYRAKMVKLTYHLVKNNIKQAKKMLLELEKIEGSMQMSDLLVLAYLEAIYNMKSYDYHNSFQLLKTLQNYNSGYIYFDALVLEQILDVMYHLNSPLFYEVKESLKELYLKYNAFDKMQKLEELYLRYAINNGFLKLVDKRLKELKVGNNIFLLYSGLKGEKVDTNWDSYNYAKMIYLYQMNRSFFKVTYENKLIDATEEEIKVLSFLYDKEYSNDFFERLNTIYLPYALEVKNYFLIKLVTKHLIKELKQRCRYKKALDIYQLLISFEEERAFYC